MPKPRGIIRPLGQAIVLAIGFGSLFAIAVAWGLSILESILPGDDSFRESLVVCADGTPLIQRSTWFQGYPKSTYHALNGSEVPGPKGENYNLLEGASLAIPRRGITFPLEGSARVSRFSDAELPPKLWYFLHDGARDGRGYFVGYDSANRQRVGFIGLDGYRPDLPPVEQWFPMDGVKLAEGEAFSRYAGASFLYNDRSENPWKVDMISGNELLEVDLRSRSVTTLMESAGLIVARPLATVSTEKAAGEDRPRAHRHEKLAVRTSDRVIVFDAPEKQHAYVIPEELRDRGTTFYELDAKTAIVIDSHLLSDRRSREELFWIDASGKISRQAEATIGKAEPHYDENQAWTAASVVPVPVVLTAFAMLVPPLDAVNSGRAPNYSTALAHFLAVIWPPLLAVTLLSAALAVYCIRRHGRYCQSYGAVWFVVVLLTGLPGLVGYLFHRRWPVLEKCPACGHSVPRDREACTECGKAFPPPELTGCEVFAGPR
jgi:hypothetical protein